MTDSGMSSGEIYECIECPQMTPGVDRGDAVIIVDDQADEPLFCPWCGNQTLVKGGVDWDDPDR